MAGIKGKSHDIAPETVERLAQIGATQREMANFFGVDIATMERRLADPQYRAFLNAGDANLNISLRRKQVEMALAGDRTMLIWLGKQRLGQADKLEHSGGVENTLNVNASDSLETLRARVAGIAEREREAGVLPIADAQRTGTN